jgi:hypothetical protein
VAVVRLVAGVAGRREGYGVDHFSIFGRVLVEIDDGEKVWSDLGLVLRPDVEDFIDSMAVVVFVSALTVLAQGDGRCAKYQRGRE